MKKQDLLRIIDNELLEELFGFCYTRTKDSYEAEELAMFGYCFCADQGCLFKW